MTTFYEVTALILRLQEDGTSKRTTERYIIERDHIMTALNDITAELIQQGDTEITNIKRTRIAECIPYTDLDIIYQATVHLITLDEKTQKEKRTAFHLLTVAPSFEQAKNNVVSYMSKSICSYEFTSIQKTAYLDIIPRKQD